MIPDEQPKAASEPSDATAPSRSGGPRRRSRRGGRRHSKRRGPSPSQDPADQNAAAVMTEESPENFENAAPAEMPAGSHGSHLSESVAPEESSAETPIEDQPAADVSVRSAEAPLENRHEERPERRDRRDRQPEHQMRQERPERPERRPEPEPVAEFKTPSVTDAIDQVTKIIQDLKQTLNDMEEVLETLELAERQKIDDEREIESLQRALRQLRQHQSGGSHRR